jgi:hypothetical protein
VLAAADQGREDAPVAVFAVIGIEQRAYLYFSSSRLLEAALCGLDLHSQYLDFETSSHSHRADLTALVRLPQRCPSTHRIRDNACRKSRTTRQRVAARQRAPPPNRPTTPLNPY